MTDTEKRIAEIKSRLEKFQDAKTFKSLGTAQVTLMANSWDDISFLLEQVDDMKEELFMRKQFYPPEQLLVEEIAELKREVERLRMQVVACGVAALGNTESSKKERITPDNEYWSASYGDVCNAVAREIKLRLLAESHSKKLKFYREIIRTVLLWAEAMYGRYVELGGLDKNDPINWTTIEKAREALKGDENE